MTPYREAAERTDVNITKIIKGLGLSEDASEEQILEKIADLKRASDDEEEELDALQRIERGEHEQVAVNDDQTLEVTLLFPLQSGTEKIHALVLRRPKFKHLREMDRHEGDIAKAQALIAAVTNRSMKELNELDEEDLLTLNAGMRFFKRRRRTGAAA
ncbi:phage tail assembly protein [Nannocystis pusilla]|uniref:Phage tail assembly protein n=1 Tax=Nannocystis pusilla TaxID=889268 RepID=A0A9X3J008_9BACT|nr:phage tail assembly protein [Nannocystis pusilla]MCY1003992.1 phage tail assembly protein [Nannocystis pusilla]MCY1008518.1 phage tail assembly protein [Nannocystis pusilla]